MDDAQGARERRRVTGVCAWLGFTLATLFLYPLAAALDSGIYYLQWQRRDLVETLTALASLRCCSLSRCTWSGPYGAGARRSRYYSSRQSR